MARRRRDSQAISNHQSPKMESFPPLPVTMSSIQKGKQPADKTKNQDDIKSDDVDVKSIISLSADESPASKSPQVEEVHQ
jgi:hypothetical protein